VSKNNTIVLKELPTVAFNKRTVVSDALFYNLHEDGHLSPVKVLRHKINATKTDGDSVGNVQTTDTAKTEPDAKGLRIAFSIRFLPMALEGMLKSCFGKNEDVMRQLLEQFTTNARSSSAGLEDIANRYARNILNGRWLWRNRALSNQITINVFNEDKKLLAATNAKNVSLHHFNDFSEQEKALGQYIISSLNGNASETYHVEADILFGFTGSVEVYPTQNMLTEKVSGSAKSLYRLGPSGPPQKDITYMGQAAFRDTKINNALRTFDTWYNDFPKRNRPIPVEFTGANLEHRVFFRSDSTSAFNLLKNIGTIDPNSDEGKFLQACFIRGGVFAGKE